MTMSSLASPPPAPPTRPIRRAAITNLGCKVNQAEMDAVERLLRARGVEIAANGGPADLHLVNTCTVTSVADDKSRKAVRRARRASPGATVVVTGCSVQVGGASFAAVDPAARLVANEAKDGLLAEVERLLGSPALPGDGPHGPLEAALPTLAGVEIEGIADARARIERTRAYVKVQDGCSFFCTYCIIPRARGPERSLAPEVVLADVRRALAAGHREVVLTGINIGTYDGGRSERGPRGAHLRAALALPGLVRRILAETPVERIRLSSIEPQHVDDDLLAAWTEEGAGRCLPHVHLPLQSGDDGVLRRMGRRYATADYARVVERVRAAIPGVAIHADVIAGFPSEDDDAFGRTRAFLRALDPAGLHVFRYSARPGTPAVRMAAGSRRHPEGAGGSAPRRRGRGAPAVRGAGRGPPPDGPLRGARRPARAGCRLGRPRRGLRGGARRGPGRTLPRRSDRDRRGPPRRSGRSRARHRADRLPRRRPIRRPPARRRTLRAMSASCLFCRIIAGEIPATAVHSDDLVIAIRDVAPQAPTHVLLLPREHIASAADLTEAHGALLGRLFAVAADLARSEGISERGYRLTTNVGTWGGQSVPHLHLHLMGGRAFDWPPG